MTSHSTSRRTLLKLAGGTTVAASLAGCSGMSPFGSDDGPPYRSWVPADSTSKFAYLDTSSDTTERTELADASGLEDQEQRDSLAGLLFLYAGYSTVTLTLGGGAGVLRNATLSALVPDDVYSRSTTSTENDSEAQPENSTIEGVLVAGQALVLFGAIDVEELRTAINPTYEETDSRDGFTIFARPGEADSQEFAAGDDAVVLPIGPDSDSIVTTMLDTVTGDADRFVDRENMGSAVDEAGSGQIVYGSLEPSEQTETPENDSFDLGSLFEDALPWSFRNDATGVVSSTSSEADAVTGEIALVYDQASDVPETETIEEQITPTTADEYEVSVDETKVLISGEWPRASESDTTSSD